jgi:predicted nucleotidyltransferase
MCRICSNGNSIGSSKIKESLVDFLHKIIDRFEVDQIILFGSFARGDFHENSDVDLIIVGDFKEDFFSRIGKILEIAPLDLDIEPFIYTRDEFNKMKKDENPFILKALSEGIMVL